jgi:hypothetical protein
MTDLQTARKAAERGIASSSQHAGPEWQEVGISALRLFLRWNAKMIGNYEEFTMEEARLWMASQGVGMPDELRAFGALTQRAIREGLIEQAGFARTNSSNRSFKQTYRAA